MKELLKVLEFTADRTQALADSRQQHLLRLCRRRE